MGRHIRRGDRVVDGTGLENRQGVKAFEGSNPSLSAKSAKINKRQLIQELRDVRDPTIRRSTQVAEGDGLLNR
jgi:hypothetical protein